MSWTPIHRQMLKSSIWEEPDHVRIVWITLLLSAERDGMCPIKTVRGLSYEARTSIEKAQDALNILSAPDSRVSGQDYDGRRIEITPDGILILNWSKYQVAAKSAAAREAHRIASAKHYQKTKSSEDECDGSTSWSGRKLK